MNVPFLDLKAAHEEIGAELDAAFRRVRESGWYIMGPELEAFEAEFAAYSGAAHCVGVGNGLEALHLLLRAYGIGPGDEVLVPSNTFIATWLAVTQCGATPVPVEPDPGTMNIDPARLARAVTPRTRAVMPVHLYGQPADMDPIMEFAAARGLVVIEDAAQSQGARYKGRPAGSLGHAAGTSFYPGKNLGALGDGGAVLTSDAAIADKVRRLRNYGSAVKYHHDVAGYNSRLDELQAALLRVKLRRLDEWNGRRRSIARSYLDGLAGLPLSLPVVPQWAEPAWHLFVVQSRGRDALQKELSARGVGTVIHYPIPAHRQACYAAGPWGPLPIAERLSAEVLSLPMDPTLRPDAVARVVSAVRAATEALGRETGAQASHA